MGIPPGLSLLPSTLGTRPNEGSKVGVFPISWSTTTPFGQTNINLLQQTLSGQFSSPQGVFIDNSTCPYTVMLTCNQTGHTIKVPPFASGLFPLLSSQSPSYAASLVFSGIALQYSALAITQCTTTFYFLNTQQSPYINSLPVYGNIFFNATFNQITGTSGATVFIIDNPGSNAMILINAYNLSVVINGVASVTYDLTFELVETNLGNAYVHDIFSTQIITNANGLGVFNMPPKLYTFPLTSYALNSAIGWQAANFAGNFPTSVNFQGNINFGLVTVE